MISIRNLAELPLPAPRLQLRWAKAETGDPAWPWECHYELVLPLRDGDLRCDVYNDEGDIIGEIEEFVVAMKEPTRRGIGTRTPCQGPDGQRFYDAPYRDGAHALWDAEALGGLPVYVIGIDGMAFQREEKS